MEANVKEIIRQFVEGVCLSAAADLESIVLEELLTGFENNNKEARRAMRKLMAHDKVRFFCAACRVSRAGMETAGHEYIAKLLIEDDLLQVCLMDPRLFSREAAVALARLLSSREPQLDFKLMHLLFQGDHAEGGHLDIARAQRVLEMVTALPKHTRILPLLMKLRRLADPGLRSRAVLLFCQVSRNPQWAERQLADADPLVRASAVEGLWGNDSPGVREVLYEGAHDTDPSVVANALVGLYSLDGRTAVTQPENRRVVGQLEEMAAQPASRSRAAAAAAMGQTRNADFVPLLGAMVKDGNPQVRSAALRALVRIRKGVGRPTEAGHWTLDELADSPQGAPEEDAPEEAGAEAPLSLSPY